MKNIIIFEVIVNNYYIYIYIYLYLYNLSLYIYIYIKEFNDNLLIIKFNILLIIKFYIKQCMNKIII